MSEDPTNYRLDGEPESKRKGVPFTGVWMPGESRPEFSCDVIMPAAGGIAGGFYMASGGGFRDNAGRSVNPDWWAIAPEAP
jgi:hypothetical protein